MPLPGDRRTVKGVRQSGIPLALAAILFVESAYYSILAPLVPFLRHDLGATDSQIGLLIAAYPLGLLFGGVAALLLVDRVGLRRSAAGGLLLMAFASAPFGLVEEPSVLTGLRVVQGIGGAFAWTGAIAWIAGASRSARRGQTIGGAMGLTIAGGAIGPAVGGAALALGLGASFLALAVGQAALAVAVARIDLAGGSTRSRPGLPNWGGIVLMRRVLLVLFVAAIWFGAFEVLIPLRLSDLGGATALIAAVFILGAIGETLISPLAGRVADRSGPTRLVRAGLLCTPLAAVAASVTSSVGLVSVLAVFSWIAVAFVLVPAISHLSGQAQLAGAGQGTVWAMVNLVLAAGATLGASLSGGLAEYTTPAVPFLVVALICIVVAIRAPLREPSSAVAPARN